jgi:hypothetical protein
MRDLVELGRVCDEGLNDERNSPESLDPQKLLRASNGGGQVLLEGVECRST